MTPAHFEPGTFLLGRYRLQSRIAAGGMASVWKAGDEQLDRTVAVKVLADTLAEEPGFAQRFRREATTAAALNHPNLVRIFDFGEEGRPFLVMEFIGGPTLADQLAKGEMGQPPREYAVQLLSALAHIHAAEIVHRDVKPANILCDPEGRIRLTDFGIAQPADASRLTKTGHVVGTPQFMAPEVLEGGLATSRSDLYSCGIVLRSVASEGADPALDRLVEELTARDPRDRPCSADTALAALGSGAEPTLATLALPTTAPPPAGAPAGAADREIHLTPGRLFAAIGVILGVVVLLALAFSGGDGDNGGNGGQQSGAATKDATKEPDVTTSTVTTSTPPPDGESGDAVAAEDTPGNSENSHGASATENHGASDVGPSPPAGGNGNIRGAPPGRR